MIRAVAAALVLVVTSLAVGGEDDPPSGVELDGRIAAWIEDLAATSYARREDARRGLAEHLAVARGRLEALRNHPDAEVRRTVEALLAKEPRPSGEMSSDGAPPRLDAAVLGSFDPARGEASIAARLDAVARGVGGHVLWPQGSPEGTFETDDADRPLFALLEALALAGGAALPEPPFDALGAMRLVVAPTAPGSVPTADAGCFRVRIVEVTRRRDLRVASAVAPAQLLVQLWWAPAIELREMEALRVTTARDEHGRAWRSPGAPNRITLHSSMSSLTLPITLQSEAGVDAERLEVLELEFPLAVRFGRREMLFPADSAWPLTADADGANVEAGDAAVEIVSLSSGTPPDRGEWVAEAIVRPRGASMGGAGLVLEDAAGRLVRMHVAAGQVEQAGGSLNLSGRAWRVDGPPRRVGLAWFADEGLATLRVRFGNVPLR